MKTSTALILLIISLFTVGCSPPSESNPPSSSPQVTPPAPKVTFPTGQIIDDPNGYSFYLPAAYSHDQSWPVVFFFDAHARAHLPLKNYQILSESMGLVLVASSRAQNGQAPAQSIDLANAMIADMKQKLSLDSRRTYTAGFSGGARVAALVAQNRSDISGVIGCGAGFQPRQNDRFHYVGLVGMEDFNYQEMRSLEQFLESNGRSCLMEYFAGGHDWAPLNTFAKGLQWLHFRAMAEGSAPKSDTAAVNMMEKVRYQDQQLKAKGNDYQRWVLHKKALSYLSGLTDLSALQAELRTLAQSPDKLAEITRQEQDLQKEMELREQYSRALETEKIDYWRRVTGMMGKVARNGAREDAWLNQRVLNFLSLSAYMNANGMIKAGSLPAADRMVEIYSLVDPSNPEHAYLRAVLNMRASRPDAALESLSRALNLGFDDADRLEKDPEFAQLHDKAAFADLVKGAKENRDKSR